MAPTLFIHALRELGLILTRVAPPWPYWYRGFGLWWHPGLMALFRVRHMGGCLWLFAEYDEFKALAYHVQSVNPLAEVRLPFA